MLKFWPLTLTGIAFSLLSNYLALLGPRYLGAAIDAISDKNGVQMDVVMFNFWRMLLRHLGCPRLSPHRGHGSSQSENHLSNEETAL